MSPDDLLVRFDAAVAQVRPYASRRRLLALRPEIAALAHPVAATAPSSLPSSAGVPPVVVTTAPAGIDVTTLGITPGARDWQMQLTAIFNDRRYTDTVLVFPEGTYFHSGTLRINVPGLELHGPGELVGTNPLDMAVQLQAPRVKLKGLKVRGVGTGRTPVGSWEECGIVLFAADQTVENCDVSVTSAAGIIAADDNVQRFMVIGNVVHDTHADAIHMTGGAGPGVVRGNVIMRPGDDGVACVTYGGQALVHGIVAEANIIIDGQARGMSVVGGADITYRGNTVQGSRCAGLYVASEPSYNTEGVDGVRLEGNGLDGCNTDPSINHGGVFLWGGRAERPVRNVTVVDNTVRDTRVGAAHLVIQGGAVLNTRFERNATFGAKQHHYIEAPSSQWAMRGDTHNGGPVPDR